MTRCCALLLLSLASACTVERHHPPRADSARASLSDSGVGPAATDPSAWRLTEQGFGPVRAGMTVAEARRALGHDFTIPHPGDSVCDVVPLTASKGPAPRVRFMIARGQIIRVDTEDTTVVTGAGAQVGDDENRLEALYADRIRVEAHKYTAGHYVIVPLGTGAQSLYRLVFETDAAGRVTTMRGGRYPEVEYVEECS